MPMAIRSHSVGSWVVLLRLVVFLRSRGVATRAAIRLRPRHRTWAIKPLLPIFLMATIQWLARGLFKFYQPVRSLRRARLRTMFASLPRPEPTLSSQSHPAMALARSPGLSMARLCRVGRATLKPSPRRLSIRATTRSWRQRATARVPTVKRGPWSKILRQHVLRKHRRLRAPRSV